MFGELLGLSGGFRVVEAIRPAPLGCGCVETPAPAPAGTMRADALRGAALFCRRSISRSPAPLGKNQIRCCAKSSGAVTLSGHVRNLTGHDSIDTWARRSRRESSPMNISDVLRSHQMGRGARPGSETKGAVGDLDDDGGKQGCSALNFARHAPGTQRFEVLLRHWWRAAALRAAVFEWRPDYRDHEGGGGKNRQAVNGDHDGAALIIDTAIFAGSDAGRTFQAIAAARCIDPLFFSFFSFFRNKNPGPGRGTSTAHVISRRWRGGSEDLGARVHGPVNAGRFHEGGFGIETRAANTDGKGHP